MNYSLSHSYSSKNSVYFLSHQILTFIVCLPHFLHFSDFLGIDFQAHVYFLAFPLKPLYLAIHYPHPLEIQRDPSCSSLMQLLLLLLSRFSPVGLLATP